MVTFILFYTFSDYVIYVNVVIPAPMRGSTSGCYSCVQILAKKVRRHYERSMSGRPVSIHNRKANIYTLYSQNIAVVVSDVRSKLVVHHDDVIKWKHFPRYWPALCVGNSPVLGEFPAQRPVTRSFDVFFDLRLKKRLSKQSWGWWFETLSRPLWRHRNVIRSQGRSWGSLWMSQGTYPTQTRNFEIPSGYNITFI